jgi:hypothetical protein
MEFLDEGDRSPYTNYPPNDDPSVRASGHFNMSFGLPTLWQISADGHGQEN